MHPLMLSLEATASRDTRARCGRTNMINHDVGRAGAGSGEFLIVFVVPFCRLKRKLAVRDAARCAAPPQQSTLARDSTLMRRPYGRLRRAERSRR